MKKIGSSILVLFIISVLVIGFSSCQKLRISNLKANYHLKEANRLYTTEKYREAKDEYEKVLELNPELKIVHLYLGTSYSQLYRPMKTDERNQDYGKQAIENLLKAKEAFPENENVVSALGDIYDKMKEFEEAEKYYKMIQEKDPDNPKSYYILAEFYSKYGKTDEAESMYEKRIDLDPADQEGYHYYSMYLVNNNKWDEAIDNCEKRVYAIYDPSVIEIKNSIENMNEDIKKIEAIEKNMDTIRKHKAIDNTEKQRLLAEAQERLDGFQPKEELAKLAEEKTAELDEKLKTSEEQIKALGDEKKKEVTEALYTLGVICWTKCYRLPIHIMGAQERDEAIEKGMKSCNLAVKLDPEHHKALVYINLLWRQKSIVDPLNNSKYIAKAEEAANKAKSIRDKIQARERLQQQLEQMGTGDN